MKPIIVKMYEHECKRCGKKFMSKWTDPPRCGKCKSPAWNKERKKQ